MIQLVKASPAARADRKGIACPNCGRRYAEIFWKPKHSLPSYRCVGMGREGGCGHVWEGK